MVHGHSNEAKVIHELQGQSSSWAGMGSTLNSLDMYALTRPRAGLDRNADRYRRERQSQSYSGTTLQLAITLSLALIGGAAQFGPSMKLRLNWNMCQ